MKSPLEVQNCSLSLEELTLLERELRHLNIKHIYLEGSSSLIISVEILTCQRFAEK